MRYVFVIFVHIIENEISIILSSRSEYDNFISWAVWVTRTGSREISDELQAARSELEFLLFGFKMN